MRKYWYLGQLLRADRRFVKHIRQPRPASYRALLRAHDKSYVEQIMRAQNDPVIEKRLGLPLTPAVARRASLASSGTLEAARSALETGLAFNAAGGSHHAHREGGQGFCTFNDAAIASLALLDEKLCTNLVVLDLDVHQGDGTATILSTSANVKTISVHCSANYPHPKVFSDHDLEIPPKSNDTDYMKRVHEALELTLSYKPDLVIYNAGVDVHASDRLGHVHVSDEGLRRRERLVVETMMRAGIALCVVMGGGYDRDIDALAKRHFVVFEEGFALHHARRC